MKALVLGLGISGQSATAFLQKHGVTVVGVDDQMELQEKIEIGTFDLFVPSPGIAQTHPLYAEARRLKIPIKGEVQLALEKMTQPCIGVTGTNGKTTVVKMIAHCLNQCGKKARAVGNIGEPLTSHISRCDEILVVELSSYQLETADSKSLDVGIFLNIAEDHLDRYRSFDAYATAKARLQFNMKKEGTLWVHETVSSNLFSTPFHFFEGDNLEAVFLACAHFGIERGAVLQALSSFEKPEHRIEFVAKIGTVAYYNDSKATNVAAMIYAIKNIDGPITLIAGGQDKGLDFKPLTEHSTRIDKVIAFGQARTKIADALKDQMDVQIVEALSSAVVMAKEIARDESTVLFSPGCASFDGFKNYAERGEAFKRLVRGES